MGIDTTRRTAGESCSFHGTGNSDASIRTSMRVIAGGEGARQ